MKYIINLVQCYCKSILPTLQLLLVICVTLPTTQHRLQMNIEHNKHKEM